MAEEHELEVSRATFSRFKKKYNLADKDKDPRSRDKEALTNRAISQRQITDNNIHLIRTVSSSLLWENYRSVG